MIANLRMEEKIKRGDAIDLSTCPKTPGGEIILPGEPKEDTDYCDTSDEQWIWSIGKCKKTGQYLASKNSKFYLNPEYECVWLR